MKRSMLARCFALAGLAAVATACRPPAQPGRAAPTESPMVVSYLEQAPLDRGQPASLPDLEPHALTLIEHWRDGTRYWERTAQGWQLVREVPQGSPGYVPVRSWQELIATLAQQKNALVSEPLTVTEDVTLESDAAIKFVHRGALHLDGKKVTLNVQILVDPVRQIFADYTLRETYPERWTGKGASVVGDFGGQFERDPRWWGLKPDRAEVTPSQAALNADAIVAAALSLGVRRPVQGALGGVVQLPGGNFTINRTLRLDGLRTLLRGQGTRSTALLGHHPSVVFQEDHWLLTEDYPSGTVPMIEIGYERQTDRNPDEGFKSGVEGLSIICPLRNQRPVSGIMWESGLQEGSGVRDVVIANYSGYGIGGPRFQVLEHHGPPEKYYTQLNTVSFDKLWIHSPNDAFDRAIGMSVFGLNFSISNVTIAHTGQGERQLNPAMIVGARHGGRIQNLHLEHAPPPGITTSPGILLPADGVRQRLSIDSVFLQWSTSKTEGRTSEVVRIEEPRASVSMTNITHGSSAPEAFAIHDVARGKRSGGQPNPSTSKTVTHYARQNMGGGYAVLTTDEELR